MSGTIIVKGERSTRMTIDPESGEWHYCCILVKSMIGNLARLEMSKDEREPGHEILERLDPSRRTSCKLTNLVRTL
jgi:hypothetical protein